MTAPVTAHADALPSFRADAPHGATTCTTVAESVETNGITLTVTITCAPFAAEARQWDPAVSGTVVTVAIESTDATTDARRHIQLAEPEAWARAVFAAFDDDERRIYLLGGVDADTGRPQFGLVTYRHYADENGAPIRVPPQFLGTHHYWILPRE